MGNFLYTLGICIIVFAVVRLLLTVIRSAKRK